MTMDKLTHEDTLLCSLSITIILSVSGQIMIGYIHLLFSMSALILYTSFIEFLCTHKEPNIEDIEEEHY